MNTQQANQQVVLNYVDAFNRGDLKALKACFSEDAEIQGVLGTGQMDRILPIWSQLISGLGMQLTIEDIMTEGDSVAVRYTERGVFKGEFFGHPPTGKSYELVAMEWFVIRNGKIRQRWGARDQASQARQIGMPLHQE